MAEKKYPAPLVAHWPSGPVTCCEDHARGLVKLGNFMGAHVTVIQGMDPDAECANCRNEAAAGVQRTQETQQENG